MTVFLDSEGIHFNVLRGMRRVFKQAEETALIWRFIVSDESSMMPRLYAWSVGVGGFPRAGGHQVSSQAEEVEPRMRTCVFSEVELQAAVLHPGCDVFHSFLEVVPADVGFFGKGEDELGVIGVGDGVEPVVRLW